MIDPLAGRGIQDPARCPNGANGPVRRRAKGRCRIVVSMRPSDSTVRFDPRDTAEVPCHEVGSLGDDAILGGGETVVDFPKAWRWRYLCLNRCDERSEYPSRYLLSNAVIHRLVGMVGCCRDAGQNQFVIDSLGFCRWVGIFGWRTPTRPAPQPPRAIWSHERWSAWRCEPVEVGGTAVTMARVSLSRAGPSGDRRRTG